MGSSFFWFWLVGGFCVVFFYFGVGVFWFWSWGFGLGFFFLVGWVGFLGRSYHHKYTRLKTSGWNTQNKELWKNLSCIHLGRPLWNAYNFHRLLHKRPIL